MWNRRHFLKTGGAALAVNVTEPAFVSPWKKTFKGQQHQALITRVEAFAVPRAIFAKVTDDSGNTGWGECGHDGGTMVAAVVNNVISELIAGMDVFDTEPIWNRMYFEIDEIGPGGLASQALAGVDCALWDLRGKLLGLPVWKLLGGKFTDRIPLYGSFSRSKGGGAYHTPDECAGYAAALVEEGFQTIKVRLGIREENQDPSPDPAVPAIRAVREAVGDDVTLYVDANNGYSAARAIQVGRRLAGEFGVTVFEEPVAAHHYASLARVADALDIEVSAGEHEYTKWQFRDLILNGRADVLNPDVSKLMGLTDAKKVAALAEVFDRPIAVHNARPTLLTAAHLHFVASCMNARRPQEHPGSRRLQHLWDYFENNLDVKDGYAAVPDGQGLGLEVNEPVVRRDALE